MTTTVLALATQDDTEELGRTLAQALKPGDILFLEGELGAGKTTLVRALLHARGWKGPVRSPSYALVHTYPLEAPVHHLDLYRLASVDEALGLDLDHYASSDSIVLVEWADRLGDLLTPTWRVGLEIVGAESRTARITPPPSMPILTHAITAQGAIPT